MIFRDLFFSSRNHKRAWNFNLLLNSPFKDCVGKLSSSWKTMKINLKFHCIISNKATQFSQKLKHKLNNLDYKLLKLATKLAVKTLSWITREWVDESKFSFSFRKKMELNMSWTWLLCLFWKHRVEWRGFQQQFSFANKHSLKCTKCLEHAAVMTRLVATWYAE